MQDVGLREEDVGIAVGMRLSEVRINELFLAKGHLAAASERLHRQAFRLERLERHPKSIVLELYAEYFFHVLVRHDLRAGSSEGLVPAGVVEMEVGVQQPLHFQR